jgi:hypothetical protein
MPNRTTEQLDFGRLGRRHLQANFEGGDLSSDGGLMLLRQIDARTGMSRMAAKALTERRMPGISITACAIVWPNACMACAAAMKT